MSIGDYFVSVLRTVVPVGVGLGLKWLAGKFGITVDGETANLVLTGAVISGYYALVRFAEKRWPWFGVLLGWKAAPIYGHSVPADGLTRQLFLERGGDGERPGRYED